MKISRFKAIAGTVVMFLLSIGWTLLLFYIDEGRYTLSGLEKPGNIIAMSFYLVGIFSGHLITCLLNKRKSRFLIAGFIGWLPGIALGILLIQLPGWIISL